jgi:hypothetical protein
MAMAKLPIKALSRITDQPGDSSAWSSFRPIASSHDAMQANPTDESTRCEVVMAARPYVINSAEVSDCRLPAVPPLRTQ